MRILLFSDVHFATASEPEDKAWWPFLVSRMPNPLKRKYLASWDKKVSSCYDGMLYGAKKSGQYDLIISLGDNIHGTNEQGMMNRKARFTWDAFYQRLEDAFPLAPKKFVWGGHDVGFLNRFVKTLSRLKFGWLVGAKNKSCMRKEMFELAREVIGPPWESFIFEGFTFLLLNSEVIRVPNDAPDPESRDFGTNLAIQQFQFLSCNLEAAEKVILIIHDPNVIKCLGGVIKPHIKKIVLTLAGHFHLSIIGNIFGIQPFLRELNFKIVPSPLGLELPFGCIQSRYRFCTLEISSGEFNFSYHK